MREKLSVTVSFLVALSRPGRRTSVHVIGNMFANPSFQAACVYGMNIDWRFLNLSEAHDLNNGTHGSSILMMERRILVDNVNFSNEHCCPSLVQYYC
jgi:hypothetical protein